MGVDLEVTGLGLVQNIRLESGGFIDLGSHSHDSNLMYWQGHLDPILMPYCDSSLNLGKARTSLTEY